MKTLDAILAAATATLVVGIVAWTSVQAAAAPYRATRGLPRVPPPPALLHAGDASSSGLPDGVTIESRSKTRFRCGTGT